VSISGFEALREACQLEEGLRRRGKEGTYLDVVLEMVDVPLNMSLSLDDLRLVMMLNFV
jgi:hypothetical protein